MALKDSKTVTTIPVKDGRGDTRRKSDNFLPIDDVNLLSYVTYSWLTKLIYRVCKEGLQKGGVPPCSSLERCQLNSERIEDIWENELKLHGKKNSDLHSVVWKFIKSRVIISTFLFIISVIAGILGPTVFLRKLLECVQKPQADYKEGLTWLLGLSLMEGLRVMMFACMWVTSYRTALRLRSGILGMLYKKITRLRNLGDKSSGELINLFVNDDARIFEFVTLGPLLVRGPIVTVGGIIFVIYLLGYAALAGMATFVLFYPVQYSLSKLSSYLRKQTVQVTDERVNATNEIMTHIKLIKVYAWEKSFAHKISEIRNKEIGLLKKSAFVQSINLTIAPTVPIIASVATFLAHVIAGNNLTAAEAFSVVGAYRMIQMSLSTLPQSIKSLIEMIQALNRIKAVLFMEEKQHHSEIPPDENQAVFISKASFSWSNTATNFKEKRIKDIRSTISNETKGLNICEEKPTLSDINLTLKKGEFLGICGGVGSGKSSLLGSILNQTELLEGKIMCRGSIAYASQQPWILNATLKENILFGKEYEPKRYADAIFSCGLVQDIEAFPDGDETEVGERGLNLSGGQKQRISLARAVYSNRDVYLLDDPLSAVDIHVGKHIFEHCIRGALKGKTIVFVSHQLQYLNCCDNILLIKEGKIAESGTHEVLMSKKGEYAYLIGKFYKENENAPNDNKDVSTIIGDEKPSRTVAHDDNKIDEKNKQLPPFSIHSTSKRKPVKETAKKGKIDKRVYTEYMKAAGGYIATIVVLLSFVVNIGSTMFSNWWLSKWIDEGSGNVEIRDPVTNTSYVSSNIRDNPNYEFYKSVYGMTILIILTTSLLRSSLFLKYTLQASACFHRNLFKKILHSPMAFFDITPIGNIINLFARDMDEIDVRLPFAAESFLQNFWVIIFSFAFIIYVFPLFSVLVVILACLFYIIYTKFRSAIRQFKQVDNTTRSPLYSHVTVTIHGLATIHAYQKESAFTEKFITLMDDNSSPFFLFNCAARWLSLRLDSLVVSVTIVTGLFVVLMQGHVSASYAGLALAYAVPLTGLIQFTVRQGTDAEAKFISVEKVCSSIKSLDTDTSEINKKDQPLPSWPKEGVVKFSDVSMRYRPGLPLVLKNMSFTIETKEKIGIVGRTGSGKSSLGAVLFRLVELDSGSVHIDGIDISRIGLEDLRRKISLIPQDPILFKGTVRYNLDPFANYSDESIWTALEKAYMKKKILSLERQLHSRVTENGENFSIGERQLLCMARALLRNSKVLLLDEATAAIDVETDALIQTTIREAFKDCTILIIAHRLNTVLDCNRIMVLKDGEVKELGSPSSLLKQPDSLFFSMFSSLESTTFSKT